jgi:hypothetical protein
MVAPQVSTEHGRRIGERLIRLRHEIDLLELEFARLATEFSLSDYYDEEGSTTPLNWIRANCHLNACVAADRVAVGDCVEKMPESLQAMHAGEIGFAHLVVMARTAHAVGSRFDESQLIQKARESTPGKFHHHCDHYRHATDPIRFAQEQAELAEHRQLELTTWANGVLSLKGFLDPVGGAAFRSALESLLPKGWCSPDERKHRLANALVEMASIGTTTNLQVTASVQTLMGLAGAAAGESESQLPISSKTVERLACDCSVTRVLLGAESLVIDVGRSLRVVSGSRRRALNARDGCCRWPGCDRPAKWAVAHHVVHWIKGGTTDLDNLVLLCHRHHWKVHEGGWQLIKLEDGSLRTVAPPTPRFALWSRGPD